MTSSLGNPVTYPTTLLEFQEMFPDDDSCASYLYALRWPDGFVCPKCGGTKAYDHPRRLVECATCREQTYLTAGTIMHKTHTPLRVWFYGAFLVTTLTPGISGVQFQKQMGLSRNETAFNILHKLRSAMVDPTRGKLEGVVEVDETYIGGVQKGTPGGRSTVGRTPVIGAVEVRVREKAKTGRRSHYAGRLRLRAIESAEAGPIQGFISDVISRNTEVRTDGWASYRGIEKLGVKHIQLVEGRAENASKLFPVIHREFSNLKTWLDGTHHGRVERQHLQAYLNEFVFRHNRRFWPFSAFQTVLRLGMNTEAPTYDELYAAEGLGREVHRKNVGGL